MPADRLVRFAIGLIIWVVLGLVFGPVLEVVAGRLASWGMGALAFILMLMFAFGDLSDIMESVGRLQGRRGRRLDTSSRGTGR